jgi:hypothetical protein
MHLAEERRKAMGFANRWNTGLEIDSTRARTPAAGTENSKLDGQK